MKINKVLSGKIYNVFLFLFLIIIIQPSYAFSNGSANSENASETTKKDFDAGELILSHIADAHDWHILSYKDFHLTVPLPIILLDNGKLVVFSSSKFHHGESSYKGYKLMNDGPKKGKIVKVDANDNYDPNLKLPLDFSITKNVFGIFFSAFLLLFIFIYIARQYKGNETKAPKGLQSFLEPIILFVKNDIVIPSIGEKNYMKYLPYLLTVFFFILICNILGLIPIFPAGANITGNIAVPLVLALFTFLFTNLSGNKAYWKDIFNTPGVPFYLKIPVPLMPIIEIIGVITKPIVLTIRLFANITAGHIIILGFICIIFIFGNNSVSTGFMISPLSVFFSLFISILELLVAFIQAYVFTLLSAIYIGMAIEDHHKTVKENALQNK